MPNKNYIKGRRKEYKTIDQLRKIGCEVVFRSAGSHSAVDVVGIDLLRRKVFFIQCKPESMSDDKKRGLEESLKLLNGDFTVSFAVI